MDVNRSQLGLINKEHRCSDRDSRPCSGETNVCGDRGDQFRVSDVAHHTANTFHLLHMRYTDMDLVTKFVQLHGFNATPSDMAEIGDGTTNDYAPESVSVLFTNNPGKYVPKPAAVDSCQQYGGLQGVISQAGRTAEAD
jgi:hypothetical protein